MSDLYTDPNPQKDGLQVILPNIELEATKSVNTEIEVENYIERIYNLSNKR